MQLMLPRGHVPFAAQLQPLKVNSAHEVQYPRMIHCVHLEYSSGAFIVPVYIVPVGI